jgi:hypothetical protein
MTHEDWADNELTEKQIVLEALDRPRRTLGLEGAFLKGAKSEEISAAIKEKELALDTLRFTQMPTRRSLLCLGTFLSVFGFVLQIFASVA